MTFSTNNFVRCDEVLATWQEDLLHGEAPVRFDVGEGLKHVRIGPGIVAVLGGAPGMGKTAFVMQCVTEAMLYHENLRVCVANVEMPPERLLDRQLSRLSGVPLDDIQARTLTQSQRSKLHEPFQDLRFLSERLVFVQSPMTLGNVANAADYIDADLIVLDYIQRIQPAGQHNDKRGSVDATMDAIRQFASAGCCVFALSAVGRSKDARGRSSYSSEGLSLASFKESSELEFGADDAYMLVPADESDMDGSDAVVEVCLRQLKSRYGNPTDVNLTFDRSTQRFDVQTSAAPLEGLSALWEQADEI